MYFENSFQNKNAFFNTYILIFITYFLSELRVIKNTLSDFVYIIEYFHSLVIITDYI